MTALWIVGGIVVLMALSAVWNVIAKFFFAFVLAAGVLLLLHFRSNPEEAMVAMAGLGGAVLLRRPLVRIISAIV